MHTAPAAVHSRTAANLQSDPTPSPIPGAPLGEAAARRARERAVHDAARGLSVHHNGGHGQHAGGCAGAPTLPPTLTPT
eukprot:scaffold62887_cov57-Phaeocystis_antarctica.AAC.3